MPNTECCTMEIELSLSEEDKKLLLRNWLEQHVDCCSLSLFASDSTKDLSELTLAVIFNQILVDLLKETAQNAAKMMELPPV